MPWDPSATMDAIDTGKEAIEKLREAGRTRLRFWDSRDPVCWWALAGGCLLLAALTLAIKY
jgi:hypothetical protein